MNPTEVTNITRFRVGIFTILGVLLVGVITVVVNDKPYWWRPCQLVQINIKDATGLRNKSPVRSLGIKIGYIKSVGLSETHVKLGICLTLPVEVLPDTRAFIRGEGFLGDKFIELKPVRYVGTPPSYWDRLRQIMEDEEPDKEQGSAVRKIRNDVSFLNWMFPSAHADLLDPILPAAQAEPVEKDGATQIPVGEEGQDVQKLIQRVDGLVKELTEFTSGMKEAVDPKELKSTIRQLNVTLKNAGETFSPKGGLTTTAQRALSKLEDAIEQLRQVLTRINQGQGSIGRVVNDPVFADELERALKNLNKILNRASQMRLIVDVGAQQMPAYDGGTRGWLELALWPTFDRYYLLGIGIDPRGSITRRTTTTTVGSVTTVTQTKEVDHGGIQLTAMLGKVWWHRLEAAVGVLYSDGTLRLGLNLGPRYFENRIQLFADIYGRAEEVDGSTQLNFRTTARWFPSRSPYLHTFYVKAGMETFRKINGDTAYFYGAGIRFDDDDIKLFLSLL